jgi:hypothetical protein
VFRYINDATTHFANSLGEIGINTYTWNDLLKHNKWLRTIHEAV